MPRQERVFRTEAIVLRRQDFSEADRLVTIFTAGQGKMRCIAKGVRKMKSRQLGHIELFSRASVLISWGRELHIITQSELVEPFLPLRENLERTAYAHFFAEMLEHFAEFEEQNDALFDLLNDAFAWLSAPECDLQLTARYFEMQLLRLGGFQPSLQHCVIGHDAVLPKDQFFGIGEGGVVCAQHVHLARGAFPLSLNALKVMRYMQQQPYAVVNKLKLGAALHAELEHLHFNYIGHILERRVKSADFIRRLRRFRLSGDATDSPTPPAS